jgi:hypothetical protein
MSENVRAVLDSAGFAALPVYRVAAEPIGCSLAAAAEAPAYAAYLRRPRHAELAARRLHQHEPADQGARAGDPPDDHLHLVERHPDGARDLRRPARRARVVRPRHVHGPEPAVPCSSASRTLDDATIAALHPAHTRASVAALLPRFHYFEQGNCIVHHMFGAEVVARVRADYPDAHVTAHLEVPGEMFALALEAQQRGRGVVGSTSDILGSHHEAGPRRPRGRGPPPAVRARHRGRHGHRDRARGPRAARRASAGHRRDRVPGGRGRRAGHRRRRAAAGPRASPAARAAAPPAAARPAHT